MPAAEAPRHKLRAVLRPLIPERWRIVPYQRNVDALQATTVMFKQTAIRPLPAAPIKLLQIDMVITIVTPRTDSVKAEDELDDDVVGLLAAFDEIGLLWTEARKVAYDDQHLGYDIDIQLEASKKEGNPNG